MYIKLKVNYTCSQHTSHFILIQRDMFSSSSNLGFIMLFIFNGELLRMWLMQFFLKVQTIFIKIFLGSSR